MAATKRVPNDRSDDGPKRRALRLVSSVGGFGRRPNLFVNPLSDEAFAQRTADIVTGGTTRPEDLADQLRGAYPDVVARKRDISGEAESWYVYRDGHWVDDEASTG
jgi:hypothetical protein